MDQCIRIMGCDEAKVATSLANIDVMFVHIVGMPHCRGFTGAGCRGCHGVAANRKAAAEGAAWCRVPGADTGVNGFLA